MKTLESPGLFALQGIFVDGSPEEFYKFRCAASFLSARKEFLNKLAEQVAQTNCISAEKVLARDHPENLGFKTSRF